MSNDINIDSKSAYIKNKYNKISDYEKYTHNPFIEDESTNGMMINTTKRTVAYGNSALTVVNDITGELVPETTMIARFTKEVDEESFVKLYLNMIKELLFLPNNAIKVMAFLIVSIRINKDIILFDRDECAKYTQLSDARIYDGLSKLLENKIIARTPNHYQYYINPFAFFNGDRLILVKEYQKKRNRRGENENLQPKLFSESEETKSAEQE